MTRRLVIYVPAINTTTEAWKPLVSRLKAELSADPDFANAEWVGLDHNCGFMSFRRAMSFAQDLKDQIDFEIHRREDKVDEITLVGHSVGGILVRQAYLIAAGMCENEPGSTWWRSVKRFVLLASLNRGLDQDRPLVRVYDLLSRFIGSLCLRRRMLAQDMMRGSEFITNLRLQWISLMRSLNDDERPTVVQVLGKRDGVVSRDDSVDLEQFPNAYHLSVPDARHGDLPRIDRGHEPDVRYTLIRDALLGHNLDRSDSRLEFERNDNVVFILHGIRAANRGWVSQLEDRIRERDELKKVEVVTPSYGWLSALEFALPFLHRRPLRWFQSRYSDYFATNPGAQFHFVGHSNGSYILGQSLVELSGICFDRVALAGSVLPRNFPWRLLFKRGQLKQLRNDQANMDFPVGVLCSGLRGFRRHDVGVGGYEGFNDDDNKVLQIAFHEGGHSAALAEGNLDSIVDFLVAGTGVTRPGDLADEKSWFRSISHLAPFAFPILFIVLIIVLAVMAIKGSFALLAATIAALVLTAFALKVL